MISIIRGKEPNSLDIIRQRELPILRTIVNPDSSQIPTTYKIVAEILWQQQHHKCCYCEKICPQKFNDVEHYRPKARANRMPGCTKDHGYWWLAYTWENLIFSCPNCNRSNKNDAFPLQIGSVSLNAEEAIPGNEVPLVIDPASTINPVEHIEFIFETRFSGEPPYWWASARNGSSFGSYTIQVCGLNRSELRELRNSYVNNYIRPQIESLKRELLANDIARATIAFHRALEMTSPRFEFSAVAYDAFCSSFDNSFLEKEIGLKFPAPAYACK